jgi:hypothetical protein
MHYIKYHHLTGHPPLPLGHISFEINIVMAQPSGQDKEQTFLEQDHPTFSS